MPIFRRPMDTPSAFFKRTISAQLHGLGALAAIVGGYFLVSRAYFHFGFAHFLACCVFILGGIGVLITSSLYHFLHDGFSISPDLEALFEKLDHSAIYIFIAGSYSPFLMNSLIGPWRTWLIIGIWMIALLGIIYTFTRESLPLWMQHRYLYTGLFIAMGWTLLIRVGAVYDHLSLRSMMLFGLGALAYTIGAIAYATRRPKLFEGFFGFHEFWHLMVLIGFMFHYLMILDFYPAT